MFLALGPATTNMQLLIVEQRVACRTDRAKGSGDQYLLPLCYGARAEKQMQNKSRAAQMNSESHSH